MKRIISNILALVVCSTPVTLFLMTSPSWAQTQDVEVQIQQLLQQAGQQSHLGKPLQVIETLQKLLSLTEQIGDRKNEGLALKGLGLNFKRIGQHRQALEKYKQALSIFREVRDHASEASTLNNIGTVHHGIGQPQQALSYFEKALPKRQEVEDRATTLNNIGAVYNDIGQSQQALSYYEQSLSIFREVRDHASEASTLNNIGTVHHGIGQPQQALSYLMQALTIHQEVGNRSGEATTLNNIGAVYEVIGQFQQALLHYVKALPILQEVGNRSEEATTLNNIGLNYHKIGQPQRALLYYEYSLTIHQEVENRSGEAVTLNNLGGIYEVIGQPQQALSYYEKALLIHQEVGDRFGEASTISNIGAVYQDTNRPNDAIANWEKSIEITLEIRGNLQRENRKEFLEVKRKNAIGLTDFLIDQNQSEKAWEWINLVTTTDLADYTRLIKAKVANPEAQKAIEEWNAKNEHLVSLRYQLQEEFSEEKAQQMRTLEERVNQQAEEIANRFPEVAELFEIRRTDIAQLRQNIPQDTLVIQPVLLTDTTNVPNTIAFFLITQDTLKVIQNDINPKEFNQLIDQYRAQLEDHNNREVFDTSAKLYDLLIRPIEAEISANTHKNLAILATGKLRYIPFETLYDQEKKQVLLQKYPIHYLTRISNRSSTPPSDSTSSLKALSLANPQPTHDELKGTEVEAKHLQDNFPGSEAYIGTDATLDTFRTQAPRFSILHLGTHGCFKPDGCTDFGMKANTILFANNEQYDIANAALLGLKDTKLITLSACQTAKEINADGKEISGLAYVFERAGAQSVIASLWNADDKTSSAIMKQFYSNLKQGMSKSEAMRQAKLSQVQEHPYFWSPFILIGDAGK